MHRGYIKIWRKSIDSGMLKNHKLWAFWSWCLLKASHKETTVMVGYQEVKLQAGQFIFGRKAASYELGLSERSVRTCLESLEKTKKTTIKTTNKFSIITIINWDTYQQEQQTNDQQLDKPATNKRPTNDQQVTTNKNEKNEKNEKHISPEIENFVGEFINYIKEQKGKLAPNSANLKNKSLDAVDKLIRIDGFDLEYIKDVCRWGVRDTEFWSGAFNSLAELRIVGKNGNSKFKNMAIAYEKSRKNGNNAAVINTPVKIEKTPDEIEKAFLKEYGLA